MTDKLPAKPIVLFELNGWTFDDKTISQVRKSLIEQLQDYLVLVIPSFSENFDGSGVKIQAFYPSDFGEISIQELQNKVDHALRDKEDRKNNGV